MTGGRRSHSRGYIEPFSGFGSDSCALRISAISCIGDIGIGLCTDPDALPDVAGLANAIESSYAELLTAATPMMRGH